jgi:Phage tail assembly chaperone protein
MPWRIVVDSTAAEIFRYPTTFPEEYTEQYPLDVYTHLLTENGVDPDSVKPALNSADVPVLVPNVEWGWSQVRAQQRQKLYESDWTCSVSDYEVPNKDQWITYRQALRDVTKQTDPFNIEWPPVPNT